MGSKLEDCPPEIIERIVHLLDLQDICNLRFTSRDISTKATQRHFISYFYSKHVDITKEGLQSLVYMTQPNLLGHHVRDLTLVGVVYNTIFLNEVVQFGRIPPRGRRYSDSRPDPRDRFPNDQHDLMMLERCRAEHEEFLGSKTDVNLLSEAFRNIQASIVSPKLCSVTLKVVVYRNNCDERQTTFGGGSFKLIWQSAADTFHATMESLAATGLQLEKLNIYNDRRLQSCSLASDELGKIDFDVIGLAHSFASLRYLSISFSERMIYSSSTDAESVEHPGNYDSPTPKTGLRRLEDNSIAAEHESNFIGLAKMLQLCHSLETLDLHEYNLRQARNEELDRPPGERMLQHVIEVERRPKHLKRIELRGLHVGEKVLLDFLAPMKIRELSIYDMGLTTGSYREVFNHFNSKLATYERLYLQSLKERNGWVNFIEPVLDAPLPFEYAYSGWRLQRTGIAIKRHIGYETLRYRSSRGHHMFLKEQQREYGPASHLPPERDNVVKWLRPGRPHLVSRIAR